MTTSSQSWFCANCRKATTLNQHGRCDECDSDSVVALEKLAEFMRATRPSFLSKTTQSQIQSEHATAFIAKHKAIRRAEHAPEIAWLEQNCALIAHWWDGWSRQVDYRNLDAIRIVFRNYDGSTRSLIYKPSGRIQIGNGVEHE